jgi:hypothetical protein
MGGSASPKADIDQEKKKKEEKQGGKEKNVEEKRKMFGSSRERAEKMNKFGPHMR